jgi:hypothetical protein
MVSIPDSYEQSRTRFRARLDTLISRWPQAYLTVLPLAADPTLTTDILTATAQTVKERLIVITSGEHGIEGYLGSALMELFFEEYLSDLDPHTNGLLLVHAINPWGMRYRERHNPANVDLNRNFIDDDFDALKSTNPDYPALAGYFAPQKPLNNLALAKWSFIYATIKNYLEFGSKRIREAALMGQYHSPGGIYFGGSERQPETATTMDVYRRGFAGYQEIIHLDMHTGYGPRDRMTMVTSPFEKMTGAEITRRFDPPRVAAANPDEFYTMQGDMIDWEYRLVKREYPLAKFFAATCEFGTFGDSILQATRSLRITILKNQLNQHGASPQAADWVEREYRELYLPSESAWLEKALADARRVFTAVIR